MASGLRNVVVVGGSYVGLVSERVDAPMRAQVRDETLDR